MAQDLGSAILAGFQGVQALSQQRARNQLAQDQLAQEERRLGILDRQLAVSESENKRAADEATLKATRASNDQFIQSLNAAGFLKSDMLSIDDNKLSNEIKSGNRTATQFALELVNKSGELPQGSVAESLQLLPDGNYAITVRNKDGSIGAVTRDGSSTPDSQVVNFDPGKLASLGNLYYQTKVVSNSSIISPTVFRAQANRVEADADRNDILANIERKNTVLNSLPAGGPRRAAASAIAAASSLAEENDILTRLETDLANAGAIPRRTNTQSAPAAISTPPAAPTPPPSTSPPRQNIEGVPVEAQGAIQFGRDVKNAVTNAATSAREFVASTGEKLRNATEVAALNSVRAPFSAPGQKPAELPPPAAISVQNPAVKAEVNAVTNAVVGRPTQSVDRDINAGRIVVSPETAAAVSTNLREQGIRDVRGLLRLNDRDRAMARAVILATEPDANIRKQMSEEMSNIFETGSVSLSRQELEQQRIQQEQNRLVGERNQIDRATLNVRIAELRRDLFKDADEKQRKIVDLGAKFIESANNIYFGPDGSEMNLNAATASRFTNSIMGPYLYRALQAPTKAEGQAALTAMSPALSTTVAALAAEEEGGFIETLVSFFRADAVDTVSSTDFDLSRVRVEKKNGRPTRFYYTDERGAPVDEAVDATALQNLNGQVYKIVLDAAEYNSRKR
jgi:hypothetical protein